MKALTLAAIFAGLALPVSAQDNPMTGSETWDMISGAVLSDADAPADGAALFAVEAPYRAHDAATVPVEIRQVDDAAVIERATIVVDENPAPVAAEMTFGASMLPLDMELRVRVDRYSNVRVIAETADGVYMNGRFVKASGGCSAPATRDPELALASMGQMQLRSFDATTDPPDGRSEAQVMIRHPNYSGLQRDQITHLFIPAHFIDELTVWQGDEMLFTMTGGISISENPAFRFRYDDDGSPDLRIRAKDTEGNVFEQSLPKSTAS
ncbi:quinoprotein dehydrogenase-associated SoxYZ-like carrier [uncultured Jannaschia sp.]|uniref:quinoprotein dehydrogenase-associated SoxYZ-like carrier n=1 Tax=uncultured Jannaschia sp. TaxID=293347 RepID=UPI00261BA9A3|nr:quinoprotein dehydrogenase-associated SoxYZ-like carrier [uncultured Jannaschia sp.]